MTCVEAFNLGHHLGPKGGIPGAILGGLAPRKLVTRQEGGTGTNDELRAPRGRLAGEGVKGAAPGLEEADAAAAIPFGPSTVLPLGQMWWGNTKGPTQGADKTVNSNLEKAARRYSERVPKLSLIHI
eukprot:14451019-Alexandrium_andersonii.AAC.1